MKPKKARVYWYASAGAIALMGPFTCQVEAWAALRFVPGHGGLFAPDVRVWPDVRTRSELDMALARDRVA